MIGYRVISDTEIEGVVLAAGVDEGWYFRDLGAGLDGHIWRITDQTAKRIGVTNGEIDPGMAGRLVIRGAGITALNCIIASPPARSILTFHKRSLW